MVPRLIISSQQLPKTLITQTNWLCSISRSIRQAISTRTTTTCARRSMGKLRWFVAYRLTHSQGYCLLVLRRKLAFHKGDSCVRLMAQVSADQIRSRLADVNARKAYYEQKSNTPPKKLVRHEVWRHDYPPQSPTRITNSSILKLSGAFHCVKTSRIRFCAFSYSIGDPCGRSVPIHQHQSQKRAKIFVQYKIPRKLAVPREESNLRPPV